MWKLYDDLGIGIPSGIRVTGCVVGEGWTVVRANDSIGLARTMDFPENAAGFAAGFVGMHLRDAANHLRWDSLAKASVGVAAMNAWYNSKAHVKAIASCEKPAISGKTVCVGFDCGCCKSCADTLPLPMSPDFDRAAYASLASYDVVVIASEALITRALPGLLELVGENAYVILKGESLPATALFFAFGMPVREVDGCYAENPETVEARALKNLADRDAGVLPFRVLPGKPERLHETPKAREALGSPYKAIKFNNNFA